MKILTSNPVIDYQNKEIKNEKGEVITLREIISVALNSFIEGETLTSELKNKIYQISIKLWSKDELELTVDDAAFIKERAGKTLTALAFGRLVEVIELSADKKAE